MQSKAISETFLGPLKSSEIILSTNNGVQVFPQNVAQPFNCCDTSDTECGLKTNKKFNEEAIFESYFKNKLKLFT